MALLLYDMMILYFLKKLLTSVQELTDFIPMNISSIKSISEQEPSSLIQQENQSIQVQMKSANETQFFQDLQRKLDRLKAFVQSLGQKKNLEIKKQLIEHFQRQPEQLADIDSNVIIKQTEKRIQKMKKSHKIKKNWSSNDMKVLIWVICKFAEKQQINLLEVQSRDDFWKFVSSVIPGTTPESCLFKWLSERRYKITLHSWKEAEEKLLVELQKKYINAKNKWKIISEELYLTNKDNDKIFRHPKQCREHYASFLDPAIIKGPWSKQQDNNLLSYIVFNNGQKKWCKLTKILEGRTQNAIKNRYQLLFSKLKKRKENKNKSEFQVIQQFLKENDADFDIKKQRSQAVKNTQQQKNSVNKQQPKTLQSIKSAQSLPILPSSQQIAMEKSPRIITPIVIRHPSSFKLCQNIGENLKQRKQLLTSRWYSAIDVPENIQQK